MYPQYSILSWVTEEDPPFLGGKNILLDTAHGTETDMGLRRGWVVSVNGDVCV